MEIRIEAIKAFEMTMADDLKLELATFVSKLVENEILKTWRFISELKWAKDASIYSKGMWWAKQQELIK